MRDLQIKGIETLESDLNQILENDYYLKCRYKEKDDYVEYTYNYECGEIFLHIEGIDRSYFDVTFKLEDEQLPFRFVELVRLMKVVWSESMRKSITKLEEEKDYVITRKLYTHEMKTRNEVEKLFEKSGWVIPHYLFWNGKLSENASLYAVVSTLNEKPMTLIVGKELSKNVINEIEMRGYPSRAHQILALQTEM